jgi:beta-xylosidase
MIIIKIGELEFDFQNFESAIEFLTFCKMRYENPITEGHEHDFSWCEVSGKNYCKCGEVE